MIARSAKKPHWVTLANGPSTPDDSDGYYEPLRPEGVWAAIGPFSPQDGGRAVQSLVTIDYHAQVGLETRMLFTDPSGTEHRLFVRGVQNVDYANVELVLTCEEAI